jgi:hypothetical protein
VKAHILTSLKLPTNCQVLMPLRVVSNENNVLTLRLVGFATGDDEVTVIPTQPGPLVSFPYISILFKRLTNIIENHRYLETWLFHRLRRGIYGVCDVSKRPVVIFQLD